LEQAFGMDLDTAQARLVRLQTERFEALALGAAIPSPYMTRLDAALEDARTDYVTSAVFEIAVLRESLAGPAYG
jgi:hypothetical protein